MLGAVFSQAYEQRLPVVDANSERVLCRYFGEARDPRRGAGRRWLWDIAEAVLPSRRVGDFNQALMELGALVCTSAKPQCERCPLAVECVAKRRGLQDELPALAGPPRIVQVHEVAVVLRRKSRVLLVQRPKKGRWAGMWEFPRTVLRSGETHEAAAIRGLRDLAGIEADLIAELITVNHTVTNHRIALVCFEARHRRAHFAPPTIVKAGGSNRTRRASFLLAPRSGESRGRFVVVTLRVTVFPHAEREDYR